MGAPYLGQLFVAASLRRHGHEVAVLDLAAPSAPRGDEALAQIRAADPDVLGLTLFTANAARGYALLAALPDLRARVVVGGPHATICPAEPLRYGAHVSIAGEGELSLPRVVDALERGLPLDGPGVTHDGGSRPAEALADLDALPFGHDAVDLFDPAWYGGVMSPGGVITSRGCPARCTFCANYVTGRVYRYRSPASVVGELVALREAHGLSFVPFWDDAFTASRPRLEALCDAILAEPRLRGLTWSCITPGVMVKPWDLDRMARAGCVAVNFGIESGDLQVLKDIKKGQRPEQVVQAVEAAKAAGMRTIVNVMFGFPGEGVDALERTQALMDRLAPSTDFFNNRGVLVPFPGTEIYARHADEYGFRDWWLDPARVPDEPDLAGLSAAEAAVALEVDPTLALDFFRYSAPVRDAIAACVRFKAQHNARRVAALIARHEVGLTSPRGGGPPAAAATA